MTKWEFVVKELYQAKRAETAVGTENQSENMSW